MVPPGLLAPAQSGAGCSRGWCVTTWLNPVGCPPTELHIIGDPGGYWGVICAVLPPLTDGEITSASTVLRRVSAGIFDDVPEQSFVRKR
ncbi:MAG: hypothetical protein ACRDRE_26000 [Pseudonocardiaceae bacterium]